MQLFNSRVTLEEEFSVAVGLCFATTYTYDTSDDFV